MSCTPIDDHLLVDPCEECDADPGEAEGTVVDHTTFVWYCPNGHRNALDVTARYEED